MKPPLPLGNNTIRRHFCFQKILSATLLGAFFAIAAWRSNESSRSDTNTNLLHAITSDHQYVRSRSLQVTGQQQQCNATCCAANFCNSTTSPAAPSTDSTNNWISAIPFAAQIIMIIFFICFSGLFAGLTLGLMTLDLTGLEIVMEGDDPVVAEYARRIYPVRKNGNLLLTTLLLGNVAVNSILSIVLADKTGGIVGFLSSTFIILIFGEIIPQAVCNRYGLKIGSATIPIVRVIMIIFLPISYPLAWILNCVLGEELATTYSNAEMLKLLQIQVQEKRIDPDTAIAMTGALKYKNIMVKDVMTPLHNTFMLSVDEKLNFETIARIFQSGYSRIPVYEVNKNNVTGLLFVKDLIFVDPENNTRISDFIDIFGRSLHVVWVDDKLGDVLRELKKGRSHMALVRDVNNDTDDKDPFYELKGIITLEDIIEEILGEEIVDETDQFVDGTQAAKVDRGETFRWARLRLLDSKIVDATLSYEETRAVAAHLSKNYPNVVSLLTEHQLQKLVGETPVITLPTAEQEVGKELPDDLMYQKGQPSDRCTLIIAGKVTVLVGEDDFRTDVSSWSLLGAGALEDAAYKPDFTAFVSAGPCRCIFISRDRFSAAVDASALERHSHQQPTESQASSSTTFLSNLLPIGRASSLNGKSDDQQEPPVSEDLELKSRKNKFMAALQAVGAKAVSGGSGGASTGSHVHHGGFTSAPSSIIAGASPPPQESPSVISGGIEPMPSAPTNVNGLESGDKGSSKAVTLEDAKA